MPYACTAGDDNPVVVHLQQLDGAFEVADFCQDHWGEFIVASALAMGLVYPPESAAQQPPTAGPPAEDAAAAINGDQGEPAPEAVTVPAGAATEDQRPDAGDPAPY